MKEQWKKASAMFLSMILTIGMIWGGGQPLNVKAASQLEFTFSITWEGEYDRDAAEAAMADYSFGLSIDNIALSYSEMDAEWDADGRILTYRYVIDPTAYPEGYYYYTWYCGNCEDNFTREAITGRFYNDPNSSFSSKPVKETMCKVVFKDREDNTVYRETFIPIDYSPYKDSNIIRNLNSLPKKADHTFKGWVTEDGSPFVLGEDTVTGATTLYADWEHPSGLCHNDTYHWYGCPDCADVKTSAEELHNWDDGIVTKEPTETETGSKTYTCQTCNYEKTEILASTGQPTVSGNDPVTPGGDDDNNNPINPGGNDNNNDNPANPGSDDNNNDNPANPDGGESNHDNNSNTGVSTDNSDTTGHFANGGSSTGNQTANGGNKEPRTGDFFQKNIYATIAMIAGLSYLLLYFTDRKRGITTEEKNARITRMIRWAQKGGILRRIAALAAVFLFLVYYHSIGKSSNISLRYHLMEK